MSVSTEKSDGQHRVYASKEYFPNLVGIEQYDSWTRIKRISHLHLNEGKLYFFGRLYGRGAIFRTGASDLNVDWKLDTFAPGESGSSLKSPINDINAYVMVQNDVFACGYAFNNPVNNYDEKRSAAVMKLSKDSGAVAFVK